MLHVLVYRRLKRLILIRARTHTRNNVEHLIQTRQRLDTQVSWPCPAMSYTALNLGVYKSMATEYQDLHEQLVIFRFEFGAVATKLLDFLPQCRLAIVVRYLSCTRQRCVRVCA